MIVEYRTFKCPRTLFHIYSNERSLTIRVTRYGVRIGRPAKPAPEWIQRKRGEDPWKRLSLPRVSAPRQPHTIKA